MPRHTVIKLPCFGRANLEFIATLRRGDGGRIAQAGLPGLKHHVLPGEVRKVRLCPIWPTTARLLRDLINAARPSTGEPADAPLFTNARGETLTRFGVRYLLNKHLAVASEQAVTLRD
jgi:hypothetical protein